MINLRGISITLCLGSVLFIGCSSEKTALLKPEPIKKKIVILEKSKTLSKEEKLWELAIFGGEISLEEGGIESVSSKALIEQRLTLKEGWKAFTKEDEILETARTFLGVKYIWAANGPSAFDCSGFTKYVFKKNGIALPRYSGHQANIGKKIKFEDLEKGDLVFFDTTKKFRKKVNHVGIFMGNNKFIHASSGGKRVMITSFSKRKFYKNKFLYARRIINSNESVVLNTNIKKKCASIN